MMRRIYISLFSMLLVSALYAQDKIEKKVEVTNDFEATLLEQSKSPLNTGFADSLLNFHIRFDYSVFDKPYQDLYEFSPVQSFQVGMGRGKAVYPVMYTKIKLGTSAFGNIEPLGSIYIRPKFGERFSMLFGYTHDSKWGVLPKAMVNERNVMEKSKYYVLADDMFNKFNLAANYSWKTGEAYANMYYVNAFNTFYGSDYRMTDSHVYARDSLSHAVDRIDARIGARSTNADRNSFYYDASVRYRYAKEYRLALPMEFYNPYAQEQEHQIDADVKLGAVFKSRHLVFLGISSKNIFMNTNRIHPTGMIEFRPSYVFENKIIYLKAGIGGGFSYGALKIQDMAYLFPEIEFKYKIIRDYLWLDVQLTGSNTLNSYYTMTEKTKWLTKDVELRNTAMPIHAQLNISGKAKGAFSYSLGCAYSYRDELPMISYDPLDHNMLDVLYAQNVNTFRAHVDAYLNFDFLNVMAKFKYFNYFGQKLSMLPDFEAEASIKYNYMHRIFVGAKCYYRNAVTAIATNRMETRVASFIDLGIDLAYSINQEVTVFLEAENLLNQSIIYVPNYVETGMKFSAGIYFKF